MKPGCWALFWLLSPGWALSAEPVTAEDVSPQRRADPVLLEAERVDLSLETGALEAHDAHLRVLQPALALYAGQLWRLPSGEWRAERLELQPCGCERGEGWPLRLWASRGVLELDPLTQTPAWLRLKGPRLLLGRSSVPAPDFSPRWSLPLPPLNIPLDPVIYEELRRVRLWHEQAGWSLELPLWRGGGGPVWGPQGFYQLGGGWRAGLGPQLELRVATQRLGHRLEGTLEGVLEVEGAFVAPQAGTRAPQAGTREPQAGTRAPRGILRAQLMPQSAKGIGFPVVQVNAQVEAVTDGEMLTYFWREPLETRRTWLESGLMVGVPWNSGRVWLQLTHDTELTTGAGSTTVGSFPWWGLEQALPKVGWGDALWGVGGGGLLRLEGWQDLLLPGWTGGLTPLLPTPTQWGGLVETRLNGQVGLGAVGLEPWGWVQGAGERAESGEAGAVVRGIWGLEARLPLSRTYTREGVTRVHRIIPVLGLAQGETWTAGTLPAGGRLALGEGWEAGVWGILRQELLREGALLSGRRSWLETGMLLPGGIPRLAEGLSRGEETQEWREALRGWLRVGMDWGEGMQLEGGAQVGPRGVEGSWWDVGWKTGGISGGVTGWHSVGEGLLLSPWRKLPTEAGLGGGMWLKLGLERWLRGLELQGRVEGVGATTRVERASVSWRDACGCVKLELFVEGGRLGVSAGR